MEAEVASGVPSDRVVVAGFSQGGAVALLMLRSKHKLAGVVGASCSRVRNAPFATCAGWVQLDMLSRGAWCTSTVQALPSTAGFCT